MGSIDGFNSHGNSHVKSWLIDVHCDNDDNHDSETIMMMITTLRIQTVLRMTMIMIDNDEANIINIDNNDRTELGF